MGLLVDSRNAYHERRTYLLEILDQLGDILGKGNFVPQEDRCIVADGPLKRMRKRKERQECMIS